MKTILACKTEIETSLMPLEEHFQTGNYYVVAIYNKSHTQETINKTNVFSINVLHDAITDKLQEKLTHGEYHGRTEEIGLNTGECETIDCINIKQATKKIECKTEQQIKLDNHTLIIARILKTEGNVH